MQQWGADVQALVQSAHAPFPASALDEVTFWRALGEAARAAEEELRAPSVALTLAALKRAKRFVAAAQVRPRRARARARARRTAPPNLLTPHPPPLPRTARRRPQLEDASALQRCRDQCDDVNRLLGELPIASLHAAGSLRQLADATRAVFGHLSRLRARRHYELERAVRQRARARSAS